MVRLMTADLLVDFGYEVAAHGTGEAALQALRAQTADLLVTDLGLPDMCGLDMAREAARLAPGLAVVIASGAYDEGESGFVFLPKPFSAERLRAAIGAAMRGRR